VTFTARGGSGTLALSESGGLPPGLTFSNGVLSGTLTASSAGTYTFSVSASDVYGDQTTEQGYTLTIAAPVPSLKISANPDSLTIARGQTGETTLTFTPSGGYSGTLSLGCSGLPANSLCIFTQNGATVRSVTLTGNNQPVSATLEFETDVNTQQALSESAPPPLAPHAILSAILFWSPDSLMLGLTAFLRRTKRPVKHKRRWGLCLLVLLAGTVAASMAGCVGKGLGSYVTPVGSSTVTFTATPGSGATQSLSIDITIQQ
jgi:hypothetical protein